MAPHLIYVWVSWWCIWWSQTETNVWPANLAKISDGNVWSPMWWLTTNVGMPDLDLFSPRFGGRWPMFIYYTVYRLMFCKSLLAYCNHLCCRSSVWIGAWYWTEARLEGAVPSLFNQPRFEGTMHPMCWFFSAQAKLPKTINQPKFEGTLHPMSLFPGPFLVNLPLRRN